MPGLSAAGKVAELERVLGAQAVQDWAPSQTAFQAAVKTCHYRSNRGVCWHCRGSVELVQPAREAPSACSSLSLPLLPLNCQQDPAAKNSSKPARPQSSETPCGKAKPQGLQHSLGQRNRSATQTRLLKTWVAVRMVFWRRTGAGTRGSLSVCLSVCLLRLR